MIEDPEDIPEILTDLLTALLYSIIIWTPLFFIALVIGGQLSITNPLNIGNILVGTLLAAITAYLLHRQTNLQARLVYTEQKMLEYELAPALEIVDTRFSGGDVHVDIANYGNGPAQNLRLECKISCSDVDWFEGVPSTTLLKRREDSDSRLLEDSSIRPQQDHSTFVARSITAGRKPIDEDEADVSHFETRMSELSDEEGTATITLRLLAEPVLDSNNDSEAIIQTIEKEIISPFRVSLQSLPDSADIQTVYEYQEV